MLRHLEKQHSVLVKNRLFLNKKPVNAITEIWSTNCFYWRLSFQKTYQNISKHVKNTPYCNYI